MVDNGGYMVPMYATSSRPAQVSVADAIENAKPHKKVKNPGVISSIITENGATLNNIVYCPNCELNFIDVVEYEKHTKNKCRRRHRCTYCTATFQRNDHLKRHIVSLHVNNKYKVCPVCDEDCRNYDSLLKHIKLHPDKSVVNCRDCQQEFKSLYDLVIHESTHVWPDCHSCSYCNKVFKRRDHMLRHIQTLHTQQYTVCPICDQKFKRKDHALRHIREKHKMVIPYGGLKEFQEKMTNAQQ